MTNNKIKMAEKKGVPDPKMDLMNSLTAGDLGGIVSAVLAIDDKEFSDLMENAYEAMDKTFNSIAYKNTINQHLSTMTTIDYEREKQGYDGMMEVIDSFEVIDEKKKFLKYLMDKSYESVLRYEEDPSQHIKVIFKKLTEDAIVPTYAHKGDAGADLYASEECIVYTKGTSFVHTGIALKIPKGYEGQIRPRSGMSTKTGIRISNAPGTIDSNYRGEIKIIVENRGAAPYIIYKGDRIAQIVFNEVPTADFEEGEVDTEENNTRGENGFGSSGTSETNE